MNTTAPYDIEQVADLVHNGFSTEGAAMAVAESHGHTSDDIYIDGLLTAYRSSDLYVADDFDD